MFLEIEELNFKYKNSTEHAVKNFSLSVDKGEIICILGESGSGKSTVLRLICGLEIPISGTIKLNNRLLVGKNAFVLPEKRGIGMVFQDYALFPHMTVAENIKIGLKKMNKKERNLRMEQMLELVKMNEYGCRYPHELSGGQQQRVALARALAPNPSLILLDEPFSNLDSGLKRRIRDELQKIIKQTGITSIFVTHDIDDAKSMADRVVILKKGRIIQTGKPEELF